jgi:hypothetical protein
MKLDLTDAKAATRAHDLEGIVHNDRYPLSRRIQSASPCRRRNTTSRRAWVEGDAASG